MRKTSLWAFTALLLSAATFYSLNLKGSCIYKSELSVKEIKIGNVISWTTLTEKNCESFLIQRSLDGINFQNLGSIDGAGNHTGEKKYQFLDMRTGDKKVFYRLIQTDFDGMRYYSPLAIIHRSASNDMLLTAMSNTQVHDHFAVTIESRIETKVKYCIRDKAGQVLLKGNEQLRKGTNLVSIDCTALPLGLCSVSLTANEEEEAVNIIKVSPEELPLLQFAISN